MFGIISLKPKPVSFRSGLRRVYGVYGDDRTKIKKLTQAIKTASSYDDHHPRGKEFQIVGAKTAQALNKQLLAAANKANYSNEPDQDSPAKIHDRSPASRAGLVKLGVRKKDREILVQEDYRPELVLIHADANKEASGVVVGSSVQEAAEQLSPFFSKMIQLSVPGLRITKSNIFGQVGPVKALMASQIESSDVPDPYMVFEMLKAQKPEATSYPASLDTEGRKTYPEGRPSRDETDAQALIKSLAHISQAFDVSQDPKYKEKRVKEFRHRRAFRQDHKAHQQERANLAAAQQQREDSEQAQRAFVLEQQRIAKRLKEEAARADAAAKVYEEKIAAKRHGTLARRARKLNHKLAPRDTDANKARRTEQILKLKDERCRARLADELAEYTYPMLYSR